MTRWVYAVAGPSYVRSDRWNNPLINSGADSWACDADEGRVGRGLYMQSCWRDASRDRGLTLSFQYAPKCAIVRRVSPKRLRADNTPAGATVGNPKQAEIEGDMNDDRRMSE
jgi:hypothetical protein